MTGFLPPRPDVPPPPAPPSRVPPYGRRIPVPPVISVSIAAVLVLVGIVFATVGGGDESASETPSDTGGTPPSPSPSPRGSTDGAIGWFDIDVGDRVVAGFPKAWREIRANDRTFRVVGRPPVYLYDLDDAGWEIEFGGIESPDLYMYAWSIPRLRQRDATELAEDQARGWTRGDPRAAEPRPVLAGGSLEVPGWEVRIRSEQRFERYRVFPARGWVIGLRVSCRARDAASVALARAFLESFEVLPGRRSGGTVSV